MNIQERGLLEDALRDLQGYAALVRSIAMVLEQDCIGFPGYDEGLRLVAYGIANAADTLEQLIAEEGGSHA